MLVQPVTRSIFVPVVRRVTDASLSWSPLALFAAGEAGVLYDPSDLSTLFQDAAGTTPVTALGQAVGLMLDKSKGLVRGPELVPSQDLTNAQWAQLPATPVSTTTATTLTFGGKYSGRVDTISVSSGKAYLFSFEARRISGNTTLQIYYDPSQQTNGATNFTVDGNWKTVSRVVFATSPLVSFGWQDRNASGYGTIELRNISVRELPGNHAYQTTDTARPTVEARVNLLTNTEEFDNAAWTKGKTSVTQNAAVAPDGTTTADKLLEDTTTGTHAAFRTVSGLTASTAYTVSLYVKAAERGFARVGMTDSATDYYCRVDLSTGEITQTIAGCSGVVTSIGSGWYRIAVTRTIAATSINPFVGINVGAVDSSSYLGDGASGILVWGAQLEPGSTATTYQRVTSATDYADVGAKRYLKFDGVDDFLVTDAIDFTGTDKMFVCAGVRKESDAAIAMLMELSTNSAVNPGSFYWLAPASGAGTYQWRSVGSTTPAAVDVSGFPAGVSHILTGIGGISTDTSIARVNGTQVGQSAVDQGTGSYGNYPLYIGRRGGSSLPFNGRIYSLLIRGAASTQAQIAAAERYANSKTGAY